MPRWRAGSHARAAPTETVGAHQGTRPEWRGNVPLRQDHESAASRLNPDTATDDRMHGNPAEEERDPWTQSDADQHGRRTEASLVRPNERTAQDPFGRLAFLQLYGNCGATVGHDANGRVSLSRDNPEASDERAQRVGRLVESNLCAMDESTADAHPSDQLRGLRVRIRAYRADRKIRSAFGSPPASQRILRRSSDQTARSSLRAMPRRTASSLLGGEPGSRGHGAAHRLTTRGRRRSASLRDRAHGTDP